MTGKLESNMAVLQSQCLCPSKIHMLKSNPQSYNIKKLDL
jgi:hypothetical protein